MLRIATIALLVLPLPAPIPARPATATWQTMTPAERLAFLETATTRATAEIAADGQAAPVSTELLLLVRRELDDYAARASSTDTRPWRDGLRTVLDRSGAYTPGITAAFKAEGLPPSLGVAVAMVESEFHPCLESPMGARGVFQMLPKTAARFGVAEADLCDAERSAAGAARYLRTLRDEFGATGRGALLAVLAYNQGERAVRTAHAGADDPWRELVREPNSEAARYVPRVLAALVVIRNPERFGV